MGPGNTAVGTSPAAPSRPRCPRCGTRVVAHREAAPSSQRDVPPPLPPPTPLTSPLLRSAPRPHPGTAAPAAASTMAEAN